MFKITLRPTNTYLWIVKQTLQNEKSIFTSSRKLSRWFICSFIEERLRLTWSFKACSSVLKDSSCLALWKKNQFDYHLGYNFLKMKITLAFICQLKKKSGASKFLTCPIFKYLFCYYSHHSTVRLFFGFVLSNWLSRN